MDQISFADAEYAGKRRTTRCEVFLEDMELVVPWTALVKLIEPHYPVAGRGRGPYPQESILRVHPHALGKFGLLQGLGALRLFFSISLLLVLRLLFYVHQLQESNAM